MARVSFRFFHANLQHAPSCKPSKTPTTPTTPSLAHPKGPCQRRRAAPDHVWRGRHAVCGCAAWGCCQRWGRL